MPGTLVRSHDGFERRVEQADDPVLVCFDAAWSRCCRRAEDAVRAAVADRDLTVVRVDVEENPVPAAVHDVDVLPTVLLFRDGDRVARTDGVRRVAAVRDLL